MSPAIPDDPQPGRPPRGELRSRKGGRGSGRPRPHSGLARPSRRAIDLSTLLLLFVACALGGGSSFAEVPSLLYVRPVALACFMLFLLGPMPAGGAVPMGPAILLGAFAALMLAQLVPLPPAIWTALPGRTVYADAAAAAGLARSWQPLSLTPDLTVNALASLIVPAAVVAGYARLDEAQRRLGVILLVALCGASALVGIGQLAGGKDNVLYLYRRTYPGFPVGLLSNRNHQAALLSLLPPALRAWTLMPAASVAWHRNRQWLALALGIVAEPVALATGSRAGIALVLLGIAAAFALFPSPRRGGDGRRAAGRQALATVAVPVLAVALIAFTYLFGRAASIERLLGTAAIGGDPRFQFAPTVLRIVRETFPAGTGFGSFDPVFRQYEPDAILISSYFNHAHNEVLELIIMAGLPGLLLLAAFLAWWGTRLVAAIRAGACAGQGGEQGNAARRARLGGIVVAFLLLASLVDYPLRSPLMAAVFALACCWMSRSGGPSPSQHSGRERIVTPRDSA